MMNIMSECDNYIDLEKEVTRKVAAYAVSKCLDFRDAWKIVYKEYQHRTGCNPWQGPSNGIGNVSHQGHLDDLAAIVYELSIELPLDL